MDDSVLSRKSSKGWIGRYHIVDVVSGYWFKPAYVIGKPTIATVIDAFRNMFCELDTMGLPAPAEVEVEYHLMKDIKWLNELFPFVRFCESPTEKRAEHSIKSLKYGVAHKNGHTRGRWHGKNEAFNTFRYKVDGDFNEPLYDANTIVAEDLADVEQHNNSLHQLKKVFCNKTRKEVLLSQANPSLNPLDKSYIYQFIGNETKCTIYNNDYVKAANEEFELLDFNCLKRLKPNDKKVTAYWLPNDDGSVDNAYLYQDDTYIGEAKNRRRTDYNENAVERTQEDEANMLYQSKRTSKYDKIIKDRRKDIGNVEQANVADTLALADIEVKIVETEQPKGLDDIEYINYEFDNYKEFARQTI